MPSSENALFKLCCVTVPNSVRNAKLPCECKNYSFVSPPRLRLVQLPTAVACVLVYSFAVCASMFTCGQMLLRCTGGTSRFASSCSSPRRLARVLLACLTAFAPVCCCFLVLPHAPHVLTHAGLAHLLLFLVSFLRAFFVCFFLHRPQVACIACAVGSSSGCCSASLPLHKFAPLW